MFVRIGGKDGAQDLSFGGSLVSSEFGGLFLCHLAHLGIGGGGAKGGVFLELGGERNEATGGFGAGADAGVFSGKVTRACSLAIKIRIGHVAIQLLQAGFEPSELCNGVHRGRGGTEPTPWGAGTVDPRERLRALFRLGGGGGGVEAAAEFFYSASGVDELLGSGEERVARGTNSQADLSFCGASMVNCTAGAGHNTGF